MLKVIKPRASGVAGSNNEHITDICPVVIVGLKSRLGRKLDSVSMGLWIEILNDTLRGSGDLR